MSTAEVCAGMARVPTYTWSAGFLASGVSMRGVGVALAGLFTGRRWRDGWGCPLGDMMSRILALCMVAPYCHL